MSLALQHGVLYHVNGLFIIHVSEERHGGAEFFLSKKTTCWQGSNSDLRSEVIGIKSLATTYHEKYM